MDETHLDVGMQAKPQSVALSADVFTQLAEKDNRIAALSAQSGKPDLTQYAPVALVQELQGQLAALTAERAADKGSELITAALSAGKLLPAQKEWAEGVLKQEGGLAFLSGYIDNAQPVAALAANPKFILLDEPFAGVDPISVIDIKRIIEHLRDSGLGVLITDHNVRETLAVCERAYIVSQGHLIAHGTPQQILEDEQVKRVYLGEDFRL